MSLDALSARAGGLASHLLDEDRLAALRSAGDAAEVGRILAATVYGAFLHGSMPGPEAIETALARVRADRMAVLARWSRDDPRTLEPLLLEEDMRSIRALLRGALGGLPAAARMLDTAPTPALGRRALATLAGAASTGSIAATLVAWRHPLGAPLLAEASRSSPDAFLLETALLRGFARLAGAAARRAGRAVRRHVAETVDVHNVLTALLLVTAPIEGEARDFHVEGGTTALDPRAFREAATSPDRLAAAGRLARTLRGTPFEEPLSAPWTSLESLAELLLDSRIRSLARERLQAPVSPLPVLLLALAARREALVLRRTTWGLAMSSGRAR